MHCFLLALSQSSTLDRYTNNFSLFFLLEEFTPSAYPARLQVYSHAFFEIEPEEIGLKYEVRLVLSLGQEDCFKSEPLAVEPTAERHRVRMNGLAVPGAGSYRVHVEWRKADDERWIRESASWPLKANHPLQ